MGLFSKSTSTSTTTVQDTTTTTTVPQEIDGAENLTFAGVEGSITVTEPGSTKASLELVQTALQVVDTSSGNALAFGRDALDVVLREALNFASRETEQAQKSSLAASQQLAAQTSESQSKTLEKVGLFAVVGIVIVLVVVFWKGN